MIKLLFSAIILVFLSMNLFSQTAQQKVEDFLGTEKYLQLQESNSKLLEYLTVKLEEGYTVNESIDQKKSSYVEIEQVYFKKQQITIDQFIQDLESDSFNFLNYSFPNHDSNITTHYLLGDTGMLFTVYSNAVLNKKVASH